MIFTATVCPLRIYNDSEWLPLGQGMILSYLRKTPSDEISETRALLAYRLPDGHLPRR